MQAEVLFLVHLLWLDNPAYKALYLWDKPYQDKGVCHIEARVECGQHKAQFGSVCKEYTSLNSTLGHRYVVANHAANGIDEGTEHKQNPNHTKHVEEHVGEGSSAGLSVGR